jgi:hypothetical protein
VGGYLAFYETALLPQVSENTWRRLMVGTLIGLSATPSASRMPL